MRGLFHDNHLFAAQKYSMPDCVWCLTCGRWTENEMIKPACIFLLLSSISLQIGGIFSHNTDYDNFLNWTPIFINFCIILPTYWFYVRFDQRPVWFNLNTNIVLLASFSVSTFPYLWLYRSHADIIKLCVIYHFGLLSFYVRCLSNLSFEKLHLQLLGATFKRSLHKLKLIPKMLWHWSSGGKNSAWLTGSAGIKGGSRNC